MGHVAAFQSHPSDFGNGLEPRIHAATGYLIVLSVNEQRLDLNIVGLLPALEVLDRTNDDELGRALTGLTLALDGFSKKKLGGQLTWSCRR